MHRLPVPFVVPLLVALLLLSLGHFGGPSSTAASPADSPVDFNRDVKPILARHCLSCHGADKQKGGLRLDLKTDGLNGGDSGAAIVPGKPDASPLLKRVTSQEADERMPPRGERLSAAEVATLEAWVKQGAKWPDAPAAADPRLEHWAFRPPSRPPVPAPAKANPIDAFVLAKLTAAGLKPNPEADRRTLIRRLKFDLLGLPPTVAEVEAFVNDTAPDAYEKLVETYLASPHFGERWARHWLDVVRFAESNGFEMNWERPAAWPYRDWVIQAFNADLPYDRFVRLQLAGDVLGADEATGFLVGGPWDQVRSPDPVLTAQQRADELHDMVSTTGSAFLGLTIGCSRCHDHKFDPIPQIDYYQVKAALAGVQHGERPWQSARTNPRDALTLRAELTKVERELAALEPLADPAKRTLRRLPVNPRLNIERFAPVNARAVRFAFQAANSAEACIDELEVFTTEPTPRNIARDAGTRITTSGDWLGSPQIHRLEFINDGKYGNERSWIAAKLGRGWVDLEFAETTTIDRILWSRDRNGKFTDRLATRYRIDVWTDAGIWVTVASSEDRIPFGAPAAPVPPALNATDRETWTQLTRKQAELQQKVLEAERLPMVYAGRFTAPEPTFRLHRGDPMEQREVMGPGVLSRLGPKFEIPAKATDPERRRALADWIVNPQHPLTARVIVNRLWQHHFGVGIVDTPSDFGRNGGKPSHPELLDWLAAELVSPTPLSKGGTAPTAWSLKHMHRLIVTSATYRQSSAATEAGTAKDAQTRLLWRYPPRRLEAEAIRDSVLFVSGKLDTKMGGPGFSPFEPNGNYVRVFTPKKVFGPAEFRRMIYMHKTRMQLDETFGPFDCPDAGQIAPKRSSSTTPLQSLNLLNGGFVMQQATFLAERVEKEASPDTPSRVRLVFRLAFQRDPTAAELNGAVQLVEKHGLVALARAVLNANEFLYVD